MRPPMQMGTASNQLLLLRPQVVYWMMCQHGRLIPHCTPPNPIVQQRRASLLDGCNSHMLRNLLRNLQNKFNFPPSIPTHADGESEPYLLGDSDSLGDRGFQRATKKSFTFTSPYLGQLQRVRFNAMDSSLVCGDREAGAR